MNLTRHAIAIGLAFTTTATMAQFVKGNEAVTVKTSGERVVETPPMTGALLAKPCPAERQGCAAAGWMMVETNNGLVECTEIYARPGTCRPSTYGKEKRTRLWIVKSNAQWLQCQYPDLSSKCVSTKGLPTSAVQ
jgi:hypothetical protein